MSVSWRTVGGGGQRKAIRCTNRDGEQVHLAVVEGELFWVVVMVLILRGGLRGGEPEGVGRDRIECGAAVCAIQVWIACKQGGGTDVVGDVGRGGWKAGGAAAVAAATVAAVAGRKGVSPARFAALG